MIRKVRANIKSLVVNEAIRREQRNGREVIIIPSATLPDDIIMQRILYPAGEIEASYPTLDRTPAPLGHPMIGNAFVSARDPEAINSNWIGAWNENVRRVDGRVLLDKVIDVEVAQMTDRGQRVLDAVKEGDPIHTSIAVLMEKEEASGAEGYDWIARNMLFDHDAILVGEEGAATPEDGVGMLVNSAGEQEQIELVEAEVPEDMLDIAAEIMIDAVHEGQKRKHRNSIKQRLKEALHSVFSGAAAEPHAPGEMAVNERGEQTMDQETREAIQKLTEKVDSLQANQSQQQAGQQDVGETVKAAVTEAIAPIKETVDTLQANQKAAEERERAEVINKLVASGKFTEEEAGELDTNALKVFAEKIGDPGSADNAVTHFSANRDDDAFKDVDLNAPINRVKQAQQKEA